MQVPPSYDPRRHPTQQASAYPGHPGAHAHTQQPYPQQAYPQQPYPYAQQPYPQAPGSTPPAYAPPPAQRGRLLGSLSLWMKIRLVLAALGLLVTVPFYLVVAHRAESHAIMFENSLARAGELVVDGKSHGSIGPREHRRIELAAGPHTVALKSGATSLDDGSFTIPKSANGGLGFRAVYNLGGQRGIAVVTKYYGDAAFQDKVELVPEGKRFFPISEPITMTSVDEPFPPSITTTENAMSPSVVHLCHVRGDEIGCPGY